MKKKTRSPKKIFFIIFILVAVILACILGVTQFVNLNRKNAELQARKERLEQLIEDEQARRSELEDDEDYVRTQKYIEEKAKSIGYVYPDEIIFRKDE